MVEDLIDMIANDGYRSAAGGIYSTRVYEFANAIEAEATAPLLARLTALESERDALLAAAGKEAVAFAWFQQVDDYVEFVSWLKTDQTDPPTFPLYAAPEKPSDALYTMDQMRDYADGFHRSRLEAALPAAHDNHAPVAWFHNTARDGDKAVYEQVAEEFSCYPAIPLYSGPVEPIWCQACGDGMTAHDPGICGNCFAMKYRDAPSAALENGYWRDAHAAIGAALISTGLYDRMNDISGGDREARHLIEELISKVDPILDKWHSAALSQKAGEQQ